MSLAEFEKLRDAEDYFQFLNLPYDEHVIDVNRLHILKKFSLAIQEIAESNPNISEEELLNKYREALEKSYQVLLNSSGVEQKLFDVFQKPQSNVVMLTEIKSE
ncbi:MAG: nitrogenase-stabilizing/protective protein NifW [Coleofasciculaceae cyanobacterium]